MAWLICCACHYRAEVKPVKKGKRYKCSACGSVAVRPVRVPKLSQLNGGQVPASAAKALTHGALISIANHRGYKPGWPAWKFRAIFGHWPAGGRPEVVQPNSELMWWIRSQTRAFARTRDLAAMGVDAPAANSSSLMRPEDWEVDI